MNIELVLISDLVADERNARVHSERNIEEIMRSIKKFGQHRPFVVQRGTNKVLIGNGMLEAMKRLEIDKGYVYYVDDDSDTAIRRALADNRTAELASWDFATVSAKMEGLMGLEIPGWGDVEINEILNQEFKVNYDKDISEKKDQEKEHTTVCPKCGVRFDKKTGGICDAE